MTGRTSADTSEDRNAPGTEKCIVLIYEGIDAVRKIREVLGPTDPAKAPPGSIRREFGSTIMVNAAHAFRLGRQRPARNGHHQNPGEQLQVPDRKFLPRLMRGLSPAVVL